MTVALWTLATACHDPSASQGAELGEATTAKSPSSSASSQGGSHSGATSSSTDHASGSSTPTFDKIHSIQGTGPQAQLRHAQVEAVVTASFQRKDQLRGFFIQEEDRDADPNPKSSEGIFIYCGACKQEVLPGDLVRVQGPVTDYYGMTQINISKRGKLEVVDHGHPLPSPASLTFPLPIKSRTRQGAEAERNALLESKEGMRVQIKQAMTLANIYHLPRYGEITLSSLDLPRQYGDQERPSKAGFLRHQIQGLATQIRWDDDNNRQNATTPSRSKKQDKPLTHPLSQGYSNTRWLRAGDKVSNLSGVLHWSYAGHRGTDAWRIRSPKKARIQIQQSNPRAPAPKVEGSLKIASFNVLNFFSTLDTPNAKCGPSQNQGCRGAHSTAERNKQAEKIVAALCALDADIVGLIEIENNASASLDLLVSALNHRCPKYRAVQSGVLGSDAIKVGLIYRPDRVETQSAPQAVIERAFTAPRGQRRQKNRPALYQVFVDLSSRQSLGLVVNHLKSKGSRCGAGDDDQERGQGNCNLSRTIAARTLARWLDEHARGQKLLILGDLNAYRFEDPLIALRKHGYVDLVDRHQPEAYTYRYEAEVGTLDYALANAALAPHVKSAAVWHINTDESSLLDYNDDRLDPGEKSYERKSSARPLFLPNEFRASDHDPIVVGISW